MPKPAAAAAAAAAEQSASQAFEIHWFMKPVSAHLCALQDCIQQQAVQTRSVCKISAQALDLPAPLVC